MGRNKIRELTPKAFSKFFLPALLGSHLYRPHAPDPHSLGSDTDSVDRNHALALYLEEPVREKLIRLNRPLSENLGNSKPGNPVATEKIDSDGH
jgi:hypothetical protein